MEANLQCSREKKYIQHVDCGLTKRDSQSQSQFHEIVTTNQCNPLKFTSDFVLQHCDLTQLKLDSPKANLKVVAINYQRNTQLFMYAIKVIGQVL
jgi:hypothetical protein